MTTFCTIITADYYPKALALFKSVKEFDATVTVQTLIIDDKPIDKKYNIPAGINLIALSEIKRYPLVKQLQSKYEHIQMDYFRWSMKPVFISYLLEEGFEKILYLDCDMFFFNDYHFLFSELDSRSVILTPHWETSHPLKDPQSFITLFTSGFFSLGFIGVNKNGIEAMKWWAEACHFKMGANILQGIYDDIKYLDIFPIKFETIKIIRHRGCNIGTGDNEESRREIVNGTVLINGEYPIIFIHFDGMMIRGILRGYEGILLPYFERYKKVFEESGAKLSDYIDEINTHVNANWITRWKWKLLVRTRVKRFLYKLAEKL